MARSEPVELPADFVCYWTTGGRDAAWVHLEGELDAATAPRLERTLREAQRLVRMLVVDLRGLAFMDSSGLHAIVDAGIRARQTGCRLVVVRGRPSVDRVLQITGVADHLEIVDLGSSDVRSHAFEEIPPAAAGGRAR